MANADTSFPAAYRRGKRFFWFTISRLIVGPTLFTLIAILFAVVLANLDAPIDVYSINGSVSIAGVTLTIVLTAVGKFSVALTSTVLCKTYLKSIEEAELVS